MDKFLRAQNMVCYAKNRHKIRCYAFNNICGDIVEKPQNCPPQIHIYCGLLVFAVFFSEKLPLKTIPSDLR